MECKAATKFLKLRLLVYLCMMPPHLFMIYYLCHDSPSPLTKPVPQLSRQMVMQRIIAGFRRHEAPHAGDIGENSPGRKGSQLLAVLGFCHNQSSMKILPAQTRHCPGRARGGGGGGYPGITPINKLRIPLFCYVTQSIQKSFHA